MCAYEVFHRVAEVAGIFNCSRNLPGGGLNRTMCTVTFIARKSGYCLGMNRDEKLARPAGLPPDVKKHQGRAVISPSEPGGGTWIGLNDHGVCLALINWYSVKQHVSVKPVSRGEIIRAAQSAGSSKVAETLLRGMPLRRINPFRLIGVFPAERSVVEWRWDLKRLAAKRHRWSPLQWASSGFDEPTAQRVRGATFRRMKQQASFGTLEWLRRIHRSHTPAAGPFSTCMHRPEAMTVSYTEVSITRTRATMRHHNGPPCRCGPCSRSIFKYMNLDRSG
jgi:hypothetical protein